MSLVINLFLLNLNEDIKNFFIGKMGYNNAISDYIITAIFVDDNDIAAAVIKITCVISNGSKSSNSSHVTLLMLPAVLLACGVTYLLTCNQKKRIALKKIVTRIDNSKKQDDSNNWITLKGNPIKSPM